MAEEAPRGTRRTRPAPRPPGSTPATRHPHRATSLRDSRHPSTGRRRDPNSAPPPLQREPGEPDIGGALVEVPGAVHGLGNAVAGVALDRAADLSPFEVSLVSADSTRGRLGRAIQRARWRGAHPLPVARPTGAGEVDRTVDVLAPADEDGPLRAHGPGVAAGARLKALPHLGVGSRRRGAVAAPTLRLALVYHGPLRGPREPAAQRRAVTIHVGAVSGLAVPRGSRAVGVREPAEAHIRGELVEVACRVDRLGHPVAALAGYGRADRRVLQVTLMRPDAHRRGLGGSVQRAGGGRALALAVAISAFAADIHLAVHVQPRLDVDLPVRAHGPGVAHGALPVPRVGRGRRRPVARVTFQLGAIRPGPARSPHPTALEPAAVAVDVRADRGAAIPLGLEIPCARLRAEDHLGGQRVDVPLGGDLVGHQVTGTTLDGTPQPSSLEVDPVGTHTDVLRVCLSADRARRSWAVFVPVAGVALDGRV